MASGGYSTLYNVQYKATTPNLSHSCEQSHQEGESLVWWYQISHVIKWQMKLLYTPTLLCMLALPLLFVLL